MPEHDDDAYTKRLTQLADGGSWRDARALLARMLLFAERDEMPSGGLRADAEAFLGVADPSQIKLDEPASLQAVEAAAGVLSMRTAVDRLVQAFREQIEEAGHIVGRDPDGSAMVALPPEVDTVYALLDKAAPSPVGETRPTDADSGALDAVISPMAVRAAKDAAAKVMRSSLTPLDKTPAAIDAALSAAVSVARSVALAAPQDRR